MMQRVAEIDSLAVSVQFPLVLTQRLLPFSIFSVEQPVTILLGHDQARLRERVDESGAHIRSAEQDGHFLTELLMKRFRNRRWNISHRDHLPV
jgi:DNA-directed RNA polymerase subunit N (RpoN/RPB10)